MNMKRYIVVLLILISLISTSQNNQTKESVRIDTTLNEVQNQFMDNQAEALLNEANKLFSDYPPNWPEPAVRRAALMLLDGVFHDVYAPQRAPVQSFFKTRMKNAIKEIEETKIVNGARIWKLYNHGFVIRTKTVTIGFDLVRGESVRADGFLMDEEDMDRLVKQCDVLFISHYHGDHAQEEVTQSFIHAGKPVVAPPEVWKDKPIYTSITHLDRAAHTLQTLPVQGGKQMLKVVIYPGHQGADIENNVPLVITPEGLSFSQMGDQSNQDDFKWIDEVGNNHIVDVLMPNCWTTDIVRVARGFKPTVIITGHENEMGHTIDHREPYWLTYQRREGSDRFGGDSNVGYDTPLILMTWGESYHYQRENF